MNPAEIRTAYLSSEECPGPLRKELQGIIGNHGPLLFTDQPPQTSFWAQNIWLNPQLMEIESISDAARKLKSIQRNWCNFSVKLHRRTEHIQKKLPYVSSKLLQFPASLPKAPLGSWTLLDGNLILASAECSSLLPNGRVLFEEDRRGPPNRAYLKLWEALTLMGRHPQPGEFCIDAGGSPGGWAWTLGKLGAQVLSVDRSPLDAKVLKLPNVEFRKGDAFKLKPEDFDRVDWLVSDVICYPDKLLDWITLWLASGKVAQVVATIKFQGNPDYSIAHKFASLPNSRVLHLFHNKHELTFLASSE